LLDERTWVGGHVDYPLTQGGRYLGTPCGQDCGAGLVIDFLGVETLCGSQLLKGDRSECGNAASPGKVPLDDIVAP
jgi:hypothetical protein